jgi:uncharacterized membrane protein (DUF4010 family)
VPWSEHISPEAAGLLEAILIGLIIGAQRESQKDKGQPGLRDFLIVALVGGFCGLLQQPWLTLGCLLSITGFLILHRSGNTERGGITSELAAVATFIIAVVAAAPVEGVSKLAVGTSIVLVAFLEAKRTLHKFIRETITETEFNDTIWYLAIIFLIYPILPEGSFGPYEAINPRQIWMFVILVSSISYLGYFFQKFLGTSRGLVVTSILGGLASTTAATLAFAREVGERPEALRTYWSATVTANAIQFPRILLILWVVNQQVARRSASVLLVMSAVGLLTGWILYRGRDRSGVEEHAKAGNPFRLAPALKFGGVFAVIMLLSAAATNNFGGRGLFWASALGGMMDADAVTVSAASLQSKGEVNLEVAAGVILLALFMNALLKTGLAVYAGKVRFGWRVALGFILMFGAGAVALLAPGL